MFKKITKINRPYDHMIAILLSSDDDDPPSENIGAKRIIFDDLEKFEVFFGLSNEAIYIRD